MGFPVNPRSRHVRPLPFPYLNALAISNDPDGLSVESMKFLREAFAGNFRHPRHSDPLQLQVDTGFFAYSADPTSLSLLSVEGDRLRRRKDYHTIASMISEGSLSTLHTFGDHDFGPRPRRSWSQVANQLVHSLAGGVQTWSNHGLRTNSQCIGRGAAHHYGDVPGDPAYATDLWVSDGAQYYTSSHLATEGSLKDIFSSRNDLGFIHRSRHAVSARSKQPRSLTRRVQLRDGKTISEFARFRGTGPLPPNLSNLPIQVDRLRNSFSHRPFTVAVLYQHLGILRKAKSGIVRASVEDFTSDWQLLEPMWLLSTDIRDGRLWNPKLWQLLCYVELVSNILVSVTRTSTTVKFFLANIPSHLPLSSIGDLCIYIDHTDRHREISCFVEGEKANISINEPDRFGSLSFSISYPRSDGQ